jgi:hypothetical protein
MKRLSYASWSYKGFVIRRNGRIFIVERVPGVRSCFTDEFPTLWRARAFVDWLAESKQ